MLLEGGRCVCGSLAVFADALLKISVFLLKAERFEQKKNERFALVSAVSEGFGGRTCEFFEVFAEIGGSWEVKLVGYLTNGKTCGFEDAFCSEDGVAFYPFHRVVARNILDCEVDMFGRQAERFGIELHIAVNMAIFSDKLDKSVCNLTVSRGCLVGTIGLMNAGSQAVIIRNGQVDDYFTLEVVALRAKNSLYHSHIIHHNPNHLLIHRIKTRLSDIDNNRYRMLHRHTVRKKRRSHNEAISSESIIKRKPFHNLRRKNEQHPRLIDAEFFHIHYTLNRA